MGFTCNTCGFAGTDMGQLKEHYDSDVHGENVRRRVAGLAPLTPGQFHRRQKGADGATTTATKSEYLCTVCDKRFATVQTLKGHLQSAKHKARKAAQQQKAEEKHADPVQSPTAAASSQTPESADAADSPTEPEPVAAAEAAGPAGPRPASTSPQPDWDRELPEPVRRLSEDDILEVGDCLFSNHRFGSVDEALCYMAIKYGFDLPLFERISDLGGLLAYLCRKVNGCMCFVCGDRRSFDTRQAAQAHMIGVGHSMIRLDEGEYADFYDSLPSAEPAGERLERMADRATGKVTLPSGRTLVVEPRQQERRREQKEVTPQRRLLLEAKAAHMTVGQIERFRELRERMSKGNRGKVLRQEQRQHVREQNKYQMKMGVLGNRMHSKGYQGDYVGRTL